jgi:hypothetical protein
VKVVDTSREARRLGNRWVGHEHLLGVSARAVVDALAARGIPTPRSAPPEHRRWCGVRHVYVAEGELKAVIDILGERHPAGGALRSGFNSVGEPRRGRITAEKGITLEEIVIEARRRAGTTG